MIKKLEMKINDLGVKIQCQAYRLGNKLKETSGADGSTEKTGWIIAALVIVGLIIAFARTFFPEMFEKIGDKFGEFFDIIDFGG